MSSSPPRRRSSIGYVPPVKNVQTSDSSDSDDQTPTTPTFQAPTGPAPVPTEKRQRKSSISSLDFQNNIKE